MQIERAPDTVMAGCIYEQAQAVEDNTYSYIMAAKELEAAEADAQLKKKPRQNNPEAVEEFVKEINIAINKFTETITEDAYTDFVTRYYDLLCKVEDFFKNASIQGVFDLIDDITCKMLRMETEHNKQDQKLCKDPRISSDNIFDKGWVHKEMMMNDDNIESNLLTSSLLKKTSGLHAGTS